MHLRILNAQHIVPLLEANLLSASLRVAALRALSMTRPRHDHNYFRFIIHLI